MKKIVISLVAVMASALFFSSCNKEQNTPSDQTPELKTYTLTISATKSVSTKQLVLSGSTLNAVWGAGEVVKVYKGSSEIGTLSPVSTGSASAVLSGTVTVAGLAADEWIDLVFGGDLSGQDGTLANIHDWAKAWFQVGSIDGNKIVPKASEGCADGEGNISFNNWTSIVRFNVTKDSSPLSVSEMVITAKTGEPDGGSGHKLTITPSPAASSVFVALSNYDGDDPIADTYEILVTSASDGKTYTCVASGKTFLRGKFYDVTLKVKDPVYTVAGTAGVFGTNAWDPTDDGGTLTYDGALYSKTFTVSSANTVEFKVVRNHAWEFDSWPGGNYSFVFPSAGSITVTFNPSTTEVGATGTLDKKYTVAGTSSQAGLFPNTWAPTDTNNDMTLKSDGSLYKVFSGVKLGTTIEFKVCEDNAWSVSYGYRDGKTNCTNSGGNCFYTVTKNCDIWIYINPGNDNYIYVDEVV